MKNRRAGPDLTTDQWLDVIAQLHELGVSMIAMTGGEPTTRDDLPGLVQAAHRGGAAVEMFTSGIGLTETKINALRDAGLWAVGVSLDHTMPEAVDRMRGAAKAFDPAINALKMSRRAGLYTFINAVADREPSLRANIDAFTISRGGSRFTSCGCSSRCPADGLQRREAIAG